MPAKRSYGSGSLYPVTDAAGNNNWYGKWRRNGRQVKRKIGPVRKPGTRQGLTRAQAEAKLRDMIEAEIPAPIRPDITVAEACQRLLALRKRKGRRETTLATYKSAIDTHILPRIGNQPLCRTTTGDIENLIEEMQDEGKKPKTIINTTALLYQVFDLGRKKKWCTENPCEDIERPAVDERAEIRFLTPDQLDRLFDAVDTSNQPLGQTDRALYMTAAMTGLRQGELLALRWRDIDFSAGRIRVRRNYVRGHWGAPKTKRGIRSVPMVNRLETELRSHHKQSRYQDRDDLVFANPQTGDVLDHSRLVKRFKATVKKANVGQFERNPRRDGEDSVRVLTRFHDLRHSFGTRMAAGAVPMRTLQQWMGHRSISTTEIYADYAPSDHERDMAERALENEPVDSPDDQQQTDANFD